MPGDGISPVRGIDSHDYLGTYGNAPSSPFNHIRHCTLPPLNLAIDRSVTNGFQFAVWPLYTWDKVHG